MVHILTLPNAILQTCPPPFYPDSLGSYSSFQAFQETHSNKNENLYLDRVYRMYFNPENPDEVKILQQIKNKENEDELQLLTVSGTTKTKLVGEYQVMEIVLPSLNMSPYNYQGISRVFLLKDGNIYDGIYFKQVENEVVTKSQRVRLFLNKTAMFDIVSQIYKRSVNENFAQKLSSGSDPTRKPEKPVSRLYQSIPGFY